MSKDVVTVERVIPVPAEHIFALLSDAGRHKELDGSGTLQGLRAEPEPLNLGAEFRMKMRAYGVPYRMKNRVIEFEQDRRIAWQTLTDYPFTEKLAAGRIWRYELEPVAGGTLVRESWDISRESVFTKPLVRGLGPKTESDMARTLERIEQLLST
jgi:uncharacterized protein YndB with AHSA1/START domain